MKNFISVHDIVTDVNSNVSTCSATVTVVDAIAPVAVCQNVTVNLDNTGAGSTTAAAVNNLQQFQTTSNNFKH